VQNSVVAFHLFARQVKKKEALGRVKKGPIEKQEWKNLVVSYKVRNSTIRRIV
jgi:hypothetical protein